MPEYTKVSDVMTISIHTVDRLATVAEAVDTLPAQGLAIERWEEGLVVLFRLARMPPSGRPGA